jgi:magnesium-protoporphyrin O-methyltransferase
MVVHCCDPVSYRRFFNRKEAQRRLRAYRRRGLDPMATSMVDYLKTQAIEGVELLEVGGGVGDLQVELLKAGVARSVNVELSSGYEEAATELIEAEGLEDRMTRRLGDFVELCDDLDPADIVVLNRVVCCYPWMEPMMSAAAAKTRRYLAVAVPREKWWIKAALGVGNAFMRLRGCGFRAFVHPIHGIEAVAAQHGLVVRHRDSNTFWQAVVWERVA